MDDREMGFEAALKNIEDQKAKIIKKEIRKRRISKIKYAIKDLSPIFVLIVMLFIVIGIPWLLCGVN